MNRMPLKILNTSLGGLLGNTSDLDNYIYHCFMLHNIVQILDKSWVSIC